MEKVSILIPAKATYYEFSFFLDLVVPDGYGLSYSIGNDYIRWTITSSKRRTEVLKHYLAEAATEVKHMLEAAEKKEGGRTEAKTKL
jgi:carnitine O-acetyltransferase